jgi:hypothetical protein
VIENRETNKIIYEMFNCVQTFWSFGAQTNQIKFLKKVLKSLIFIEQFDKYAHAIDETSVQINRPRIFVFYFTEGKLKLLK